MPTILPKDIDNHPIQALRLKPGGAHQIAVTTNASSANETAFAADTHIVSIYANVPVFVAMGDAGVTASTADHYLPAGLYYDLAIGGGKSGQASHIAVLAADVNGTVYLSEKE